MYGLHFPSFISFVAQATGAAETAGSIDNGSVWKFYLNIKSR